MGNTATSNIKTQLEPTMPAVSVENMTISYREEPVVWNVSIDIPQGSLTAIIGPNGAGKTTLLKGILGLIKINSGTVKILGKSALDARRSFAYVPQKSMVNWDFPTTVRDVAVMGRYVHLGWFKHPTKKDYKLADQALEQLGMSQFRNRQISELSGGQKQRVFVARALVQQADLYLLDEPLQGVDISTENVIMDILREEQAKGKTIIAVHHNLNNVSELFDHVVLLNRRLVGIGPVDEILNKENLLNTYGTSISSLASV